MYQYPSPDACEFMQESNFFGSSFTPGNKAKTRRPARQIDFKLKYKTELCKGWEKGSCEFGEKCAFAHGPGELREKTNILVNYKTKKCKQFFENGYCMYGMRCQFLHRESTTAASTPENSTCPSRKGSHDDSSSRLPIFVSLASRGEAEGWN